MFHPKARLIMEHSTNFALSGNIDGLCNWKQTDTLVFKVAQLLDNY